MPNTKKPDFEKLRAIAVEIDELKRKGEWGKVSFARLLRDADKASAGVGPLTEFVVNEGDPSWL